jgi:hypothetical protein
MGWAKPILTESKAGCMKVFTTGWKIAPHMETADENPVDGTLQSDDEAVRAWTP